MKAFDAIGGSIDVFSLPKIVVDKANRVGLMQRKTDEVAFLKIYDKFLNLWKVNVTAVIPGFHIRNKISNVFNNYLAIGSDAWSISMQKKSISTIKSVSRGARIEGEITTNLGKKITLESAWKDAEKHGVVNSGFFEKDLVGSVGIDSAKLKDKINPTDLKNFVPYKIGRKAGNYVEKSR